MSEAPADNVYIKEIELLNFMCHKNFKIELSPALNIVYGTNGSGKSTILTGIMIGLGSRSQTTSRGEKLSSFVRSGERKAWIHIKIHIPPQISTLHSIYGDEVTVTRIIDAKGSSIHQLRDASGKKMRNTRKDDILNICNHCGIHPNNEMAMLSQENAKEFLVSATPKIKYQKLQEALLQQIIAQNDRDMQEHEAQRRAILDRLERKMETVMSTEEKCNGILSRASNQLENRNKLENIILVTKWREFEAVKNRYDEAVREAEAARESLLAAQQPEELNSRVEENTAKINELEYKREEAIVALEQVSKAVEEAQKEHDDSKFDYDSVRADISKMEQELAEYRSDYQKLEQKLAESSPEALDEQRKRIENDLTNQSAHKRRMTTATYEKQPEIDECAESIRQIERDISGVEDQIRENNASLDEKRHRLNSSATQRTSQSRRYSLQKNLKSLVENSEGWSSRPVGPLYEYIEVNDSGATYIPALERLWNSTLESWWVQSSRDKQRLLELARRANIEDLRVIVRVDDPYDFTSALPEKSPKYRRIVDTMTTKSDAVLRILVDLNDIQSTVLTEGVDHAFEVADSDRKIDRVVTLTTDGRARNFTYIRSDDSHTESSRIAPYPDLRISVNEETTRLLLQEQIKDLQDVSRELQKQKEQLQQKYTMQKQRHHDLVRYQKRATQEVSLAETAIHDLNAKLAEMNRFSHEDDTTRLDAELMLEKIKEKETDLEGATESCTQYIYPNFEETATRLNKAKGNEEMASKRVDDIQREIDSLKIQLRECLRQINESGHRVSSLERVLNMKESLKNSCQVEKEESESALLESVGPLDESDEKIQELMQLHTSILHQMQLKVEADLRISGTDQEEIAKAQLELVQSSAIRADIERDESEMKSFDKEITSRRILRVSNEKRVWNQVKSLIRSRFKKILSVRRFTGDVHIDDERQILEAIAAPDSQDSASTSTLSGGEKSFVQVALLMAVWEAMEVGFTAMDEYDVYMDKFNRSESLLVLAETVKRKGMQCLLITPQDIDTTVLNGVVDFLMHQLQPARS